MRSTVVEYVVESGDDSVLVWCREDRIERVGDRGLVVDSACFCRGGIDLAGRDERSEVGSGAAFSSPAAKRGALPHSLTSTTTNSSGSALTEINRADDAMSAL